MPSLLQSAILDELQPLLQRVTDPTAVAAIERATDTLALMSASLLAADPSARASIQDRISGAIAVLASYASADAEDAAAAVRAAVHRGVQAGVQLGVETLVGLIATA